ncbi:MAG: carboxypeptidase-like regulatory domain-containing protein [Prolixibacteraceae bacterium]|jgi:hypothetical protein|nr:carboxypeptidase-like regulatory domain-containing protein [Prolixibacteraceae bacterium]
MKTRNLIIVLFLILFKTGFAFQPVSISGIITDANNGKAIDDINIVVEEKETGTISTYTGSYLLYLEKGTYAISFTGKGYQEKEITVDLSNNKELMVELTPKRSKNKNEIKKVKKKIRTSETLASK